MYQSAFSPESLDEFHTSESLDESMYHSMVEEDGSGLESVKQPQSLSKKTPVTARNLLSSGPELAQERQCRRLLAASEKILSARLSIDEVLLSLSSRGENKRREEGREEGEGREGKGEEGREGKEQS